MRADVKASEAEEKRKMRMEEVMNNKKLKAGGAKKKGSTRPRIRCKRCNVE